MKSLRILSIALAASLTACSTSSTLDVPPSTPASLPAIPAAIDRDPEPLGQLPNGEMGTLAVVGLSDAEKYGVLATRFNTLRDFYRCVREQINNHTTAESCL